MDDERPGPVTRAVSLALRGIQDASARSDLLFLEAWVLRRLPNPGISLRLGQIRRANPELVQEIERELKMADRTTSVLLGRREVPMEPGIKVHS